MPYLRYLKNGEYKFFEIPPDRMVIFGREEHVDFQILTDAEISREHFAMEIDENKKLVLIDLGSNNGTFVNRKKYINETVEIKEGDEIKAGNQTFYYFSHKPTETMKPKIQTQRVPPVSDSASAPPPSAPAAPAPKPAAPPVDAAPKSFADRMRELVKSYNPNKNKFPGGNNKQP